MSDSSEPDNNKPTDAATAPVKVDAPQSDVVEEGGEGVASTDEGERPTAVSVDAPDEDHVDFSQPQDSDRTTTLVHQDRDEPAADSEPAGD
jgi:hypothetical protein